MGVRVFEQIVNTGHNFNGTTPPGTPTAGDDFSKKWPAADTGGLFDFVIDTPHWIVSIQLILGGQDTWTLHIVDVDGAELKVWSGTTEGSFIALESERVLMLEGQSLKLRTTGTPSSALKARIAVSEVE